jgi:tRNA A37 methylthiotransferase MiaB
LEEEYKKKFINTRVTIIVEQKHDQYLIGHSSNYLEVLIPYEDDLIGQMVDVQIIEHNNGFLYGKLV